MRLKNVFIFWVVFFVSACSHTDFVFLDGGEKNISEFNGKWVLINYWAEWCQPCLKEIPELNDFNRREDVAVFAFNYDQLDENALKEALSRFDVQYPSLIDDPAIIFQQSKPTGLPATMLISPQGEFVKWLFGAQTRASLGGVVGKL